MRHFKTMIVFLATLAFSSGVMAWGHDGHRLTGLIATQYLSQSAKDRLAAILPGQSLADIATWMDEQRPQLSKFDATTPLWHFDDVPVCGTAKLADYCPNGVCASEKTKKYFAILSDSDSTQSEQADAIRFIVHMVGDIHQPLHSADNHDRGGNQVFIKVNGKKVKLHHAWDTEFVAQAQAGKSEADFAKSLFTKFGDQGRTAQTGDVSQWVDESNKLANEITYGKISGFACNHSMTGIQPIPEAYASSAVDTIQVQLVKAGARIAFLLNKALE